MIHAVYTLDELARIWRVKRETIYSWLKQERKAGRGPTRYEAVVRLDTGTRKSFLMLREDYARKLQDRYYFRAFRNRRVRSTMERMFRKPKGGT
jgi:hypothetical protein